jgi:DnaK suppressor protein
MQVASMEPIDHYLNACSVNGMGGTMNDDRARALLRAERARVQALLAETSTAGEEDRAAANEPGDMADPSERLTAEEADDAVSRGLNERLEALDRAERRLDEGVFGLSIRSGLPIPEARLEADPAAELTVDEAGYQPGL